MSTANNASAEFVARTDTGMVRQHNEDSVAFSAEVGLAILADGMGGYNAGEVASTIATNLVLLCIEQQLRSMHREIDSPADGRIHQTIVEAIQIANLSILEAAHKEPAYNGMGTTLVLALLHDDHITLAHVGDSRAYRLRRGQLQQITRDHSVLQEQIDAGLISAESAQFAPNKNLITRAVGVDFQIEIEIHDHQIEPDDIYLLCSDGLSDMLLDEEMRDILLRHESNPDSALETTCEILIDQANANGGQDNISAILIKVESKVQSDNIPKNGLIKRIFNWTK
ncbi:MAG: Stp1/IreP family PP2C-type Ser/Thr phosphatase [Pseudomonadota bacterium]